MGQARIKQTFHIFSCLISINKNATVLKKHSLSLWRVIGPEFTAPGIMRLQSTVVKLLPPLSQTVAILCSESSSWENYSRLFIDQTAGQRNNTSLTGFFFHVRSIYNVLNFCLLCCLFFGAVFVHIAHIAQKCNLIHIRNNRFYNIFIKDYVKEPQKGKTGMLVCYKKFALYRKEIQLESQGTKTLHC